jgi:ATP-binding cassette subfamily F protein 3
LPAAARARPPLPHTAPAHIDTLSSRTQPDGPSVVTPLSPITAESDSDSARPPYTVAAPASLDAALHSARDSPYPPPFSSLYFPSPQHESPPAFAAAPPFESSSSAVAETKAALPRDTKDGSSKDLDDGEPPPPYSEGYSPLESFAYVMASAGGPASILTQVSQSTAGPPINTLGGSDENITLELRYVATLHVSAYLHHDS